jgi:BMFP domain-containing protein YqiC
MQTNNRFFDDLAKLATGAMGAAAGLRTEFETMMKDRLQRILADMDLVTREEFEAVRAMAVKARTEQEALLARVAGLEAALAAANRAEPAGMPPDLGGLPGADATAS